MAAIVDIVAMVATSFLYGNGMSCHDCPSLSRLPCPFLYDSCLAAMAAK